MTTMVQDNAAAGGPNQNSDTSSRRSSAPTVADLLREKAAEEEKLRKRFELKIAKARKSAIPLGERRRTALDLLDRLRDAFRTAHNDILLEENVVDREITDIFVAALQANRKIKPEALEAALLVLDSAPDDEGGRGEGELGGDGTQGQGDQADALRQAEGGAAPDALQDGQAGPDAGSAAADGVDAGELGSAAGAGSAAE